MRKFVILSLLFGFLKFGSGCIGGSGGCCPQAAPTCGAVPRCAGPASYVAPPSFAGYAPPPPPLAPGGYAQAPPVPVGVGAYAQPGALPPPPPPPAIGAYSGAPVGAYAAPAGNSYVKGK